MSVIRDASLAEAGRKKIAWVRDFMPALCSIERQFITDKPFAGKRITLSIHLEAKTAFLALVLKEGGAEVYATGCNPLSTQDDVAAGLASLGVPVFAWRGATSEEYSAHLKEALSCHPHLIIDDGGDLVELLSGDCAEYADCLVGGCEETTTGVHRLKAREKAGALGWPMMNVNGAKCKHYYDNKYGTGQSVWDAIMHTTNLLIAGKTVVVAGYGFCGRGISMRAKGMGARVIVTETDSVKALEAAMDGYSVMTMEQAAPLGDLFICATGCRDVITKKHMVLMKDNAFLANAGHFNVEINGDDLKSLSVEVIDRRDNITGYRQKDGRILNLLAEGRLVNLASGNGHPAEIMDMSFSVQALSLLYLLGQKGLAKGVHDVPKEIDDTISQIKLEAMGIEIDQLTDLQEQYLSGWEV